MKKILFIYVFLVVFNISNLFSKDEYCIIRLDTLRHEIILEKYSKELIYCIHVYDKATQDWMGESVENTRIASRAFLQNQKFDDAIVYANKALSMSSNPKESILNLNNLLDIYHLKGDLSKSHDYLTQIKNILKTHDDVALEVKTYINAVKLSIKREDLKSQKKYLLHLDGISNQIKNPVLKGEYFYQKARALYHDKKYFNENKREVLNFLLESKDLFEQNNNKSKLHDVLDLLAIVYLEEEIQDYGLSEKYHLESAKIKKEIGNERSIAVGHNNYCNLLSELHIDIEAIEYCEKSAEIAERINAFDVLSTNYWNVAILYNDNSMYKEAVEYFFKYDDAQSIVIKEQREKAILEAETKYQTKEKEYENKLLKQEREQEKELNSFRLKVFVGVVILLLIIISLISYLYQQKNKLNKIITSQNTELEKLNSFKNQLFSIMGHDMRGMMSKLSISQRKILRTNKKEGVQSLEKPITKMGAIIDGLNGFIENILYWGFTQTDKLYFNFEPLNVNQIVDQVALNFKYDLENKTLNFIKNIPEDFTIQADANTIKVVIRNILANAIKYSNANTDILIEAIENKTNHLIKITDQGKGIPKETIPILFETKKEKVTQGTTGEEGTGLGLWLCKEMMEKNQGEILVESELGKGTSFILQFPKKKTA